jgi:hypothetical protein
MLVVLVLTTLLASLMVQGLGFFLGKYDHVRRFQQQTLQSSSQQRWFVNSVKGMVPLLSTERHFYGSADHFQGLSLEPLAAQSGMPQPIGWTIVRSAEDGAAELIYQEGTEIRWQVMREPAQTLAFQYLDASGHWHDRWPVSRTGTPRIPRMVRLIRGSGDTVWMAALDLHPEPLSNFLQAS